MTYSTKILAACFLVMISIVSVFASDNSGRQQDKIKVVVPEIIVAGISQTIEISGAEIFQIDQDSAEVSINNQVAYYPIRQNKLKIAYTFPGKEILQIRVSGYTASVPVNPIPLWLSILPPLFAILFALILREVYSALFIGLWIGTGIIYYFKGITFFSAIFQGFLAIIDTYILDALNNKGHLSIILFSMIIAATVSIITKNGGMKGVVNRLSKYVKDARSASLVTWFLGILIFFDDYANTLVVGNTMRPLTDKMKVSREKLAYIIDSTAAPVASVAFVTTWIGAELSYIQDGIDQLNLNESAYGVFFNSLAYSFYPFFALTFIFILVWKKVDFGPMLKAERKARSTEINNDLESSALSTDMEEELSINPKIKIRALNAVVPVLVIIAGTLSGLFFSGYTAEVWHNTNLGFFDKLSETIGNADSYSALLWASSGSMVVAILMSLAQKLLSLKEAMEAVVHGFKTMLPAIMILTLAWSIALITEHMHTADFISNSLVKAEVSPFLLPVLTFIISALISFATGSSWGTMAILYPLILPASWLLTGYAGLDYDVSMSIFHNVAAAVLTGSVLGDHCSPISDTTILSSLASNCPHIEHVRTQMPYALVTGLIAIMAGTIPASYNISPVFLFPLGIILIYLIIVKFGKPHDLESINSK